MKIKGNWQRQFTASQSNDAVTLEKQHLKEFEEESNLNIPFARAKIGTFFQHKPTLGNQFTEDVTLKSYLRRILPTEVRF